LSLGAWAGITASVLMEESRIQAVDHVNLEARMGVEDAMRWFYGEIAGLDEVDSDSRETGRLCFKSGRIELRVSCVDTPRIDSVARRITIFVESLDDVAEYLEEHSIAYTRLSGLMYSDRRLEVHDPSGNRVALKQMSYVGLL
jgi:hypothetical protein